MSEEIKTENLDMAEDDLSGETFLRSGSSYVITLTELKGTLWVCLYDEVGKETLKKVSYKVQGPKGESFEGTTDDLGVLRHDDVSIGDFEITVEGKWTAVAPSLLNPSEPHEHAVKGFYFDEAGEEEAEGAEEYEDNDELGYDLINASATGEEKDAKTG